MSWNPKQSLPSPGCSQAPAHGAVPSEGPPPAVAARGLQTSSPTLPPSAHGGDGALLLLGVNLTVLVKDSQHTKEVVGLFL